MLEGTSGAHLVHPPAKAGSPREEFNKHVGTGTSANVILIPGSFCEQHVDIWEGDVPCQ